MQDAHIYRNIVYHQSLGRQAKKHRLDVFVPNKASHPLPVVMFVHGGGWKRGDKHGPTINSGSNVGEAFSQEGYVTVSISYQLSSPGLLTRLIFLMVVALIGALVLTLGCLVVLYLGTVCP